MHGIVESHWLVLRNIDDLNLNFNLKISSLQQNIIENFNKLANQCMCNAGYPISIARKCLLFVQWTVHTQSIFAQNFFFFLWTKINLKCKHFRVVQNTFFQVWYNEFYGCVKTIKLKETNGLDSIIEGSPKWLLVISKFWL